MSSCSRQGLDEVVAFLGPADHQGVGPRVGQDDDLEGGGVGDAEARLPLDACVHHLLDQRRQRLGVRHLQDDELDVPEVDRGLCIQAFEQRVDHGERLVAGGHDEGVRAGVDGDDRLVFRRSCEVPAAPAGTV